MNPDKAYPKRQSHSGSSRQLGVMAEELAAVFFVKKGYTVLEKNYHAPCGEIDLILTVLDTLVFAEVKARRGNGCGLPQEAVTLRKQRQIIRAAQWYLQKKGWCDRQMRFDVLAIDFSDDRRPVIEHITNAFDCANIWV